MDKTFDHTKYEESIYSKWEKSGAFTPKIDLKKKPFTIVIPPPNASGKMHTGNVLMIAIEDLLIRWKRMRGFSALYLPGTDHAGFETQITFERMLKKDGKSRFDYDRETLFKMLWNFVSDNKESIENQIRNMGASVDWSRYTFTLDEKVIDTVISTFERLHKERLVYRDNYMVNYCPFCGTTFADLEVKHKNRKDAFYYIKYRFTDGSKGNNDYLVVATVRPETVFVDTHLAVNPKDISKKHLLGQKVLNPVTDSPMEIIADEIADPNFGTGIVKLTPAHDKNDYEAAKRHDLPIIQAFDLQGKLDSRAGKLAGLNIKDARKKYIEIIKNKNLLEKIDRNYKHTVSVCYKGGHDIEPTILPNWFVKVDKLKKPAHDVVKKGKVKIYPKWQEVKYHRWMESMLDWPISRQVVWGIRIPAWYNVEDNKNLIVSFLDKNKKVRSGTVNVLLKKVSFSEISNGLQTLIAPENAKYIISKNKPKGNFLQETDTFDTWFSSGQWPLVTLGYPDSPDFKYFYPTDVLETGWEILRLWVSRMIMFGIYLTGNSPFNDVYLHGLVRAIDGRKMSKSLGNVINPEEYQEKFGTDALRMGLISGTANGKDFNFPRDKVIGFQKFGNKIWNIGRFIQIMFEKHNSPIPYYSKKYDGQLKKDDKSILKGLNKTIENVNSALEKYRFADAADYIYHFLWDDFASSYLEKTKERKDKEVTLSLLRYIYLTSLKLLHPFMPFVTETIWEELKDLRKDPKQMLITSKWPK